MVPTAASLSVLKFTTDSLRLTEATEGTIKAARDAMLMSLAEKWT